MSRARAIVLTVIVSGAPACASIPAERYGVNRVSIEGMEAFDEETLEVCLTTRERSRFTVRFRSEPTCGEPPFRAGRSLPLWHWPWTTWPVFDETAFRQDMDRIRRWYEARGYHQAQVTAVEMDPPAPPGSDALTTPPCENEDDGCRLNVEIHVEEGPVTNISSVSVHGVDVLEDPLEDEIARENQLIVGERFDEATYDAFLEEIRRVLGEEGYARAQVDGTVRVNREGRTAEIEIRVEPGPVCECGEVRVEGSGDFPEDVIRATALIRAGERFDRLRLGEVERAVYLIGPFRSVEVEPQIEDESDVVDLVIRVTPQRVKRFRAGGGIQAGILDGRNDATEDVPEWDIHLLGSWEHRNLFGGLRRIWIEDRPRMIFQDRFPRGERPRFGNRVRMVFEQPGFLEPRLTLSIDAEHDFGPDPYDHFFRHVFESGIGIERFFFDQRLFLSFGLRGHLYRIPDRGMIEEQVEDIASDAHLMFFEQEIRFDLRNTPIAPTRGFYAAMELQEAGFFMPSSWSYIRLTPEVRAYAPLGKRLVLAGRFALGMLFIREADEGLDPESQALGPRQYRLRGGGSTSNRGFLPGELGDGLAGGVRRWLGSLELRLRITENFGTAIFADAGDVHADPSFRWDHLQLSLGLSLRYATIVGAIRLDIGWRVPGAQVLGTDDRLRDTALSDVDLGFTRFPGAIHLTIGESF